MINKVSFGTNFSLGFKIFGKSIGWHMLFTVVAFLAMLAITYIGGALADSMVTPDNPWPMLGIMTLVMIAISPLFYGFGYIADGAYFGKVDFSSAFDGFKNFLQIVLMSILLVVLNYLIMGLLAYLILGDVATEIFQVYAELLSSNALSDPYASNETSMRLAQAMQGAFGRLLLFYLVYALVQMILIFPAYFLAYGKRPFGEALQLGITNGVRNILPNFFTMVVLIIMIFVMALIGALVIAVFSGVAILAVILGFMLYAVIFSLVFSFFQAMYRQMDPQEVNQEGDDLQDILDVE
ncbi:MAG: hypothetical protein HWE14_13010 [Flavobacteriia bacterium]|nr:hypothetical protein [Flavobacteriia bacterium]